MQNRCAYQQTRSSRDYQIEERDLLQALDAQEQSMMDTEALFHNTDKNMGHL